MCWVLFKALQMLMFSLLSIVTWFKVHAWIFLPLTYILYGLDHLLTDLMSFRKCGQK